jgi:hypothetical protein
LGLPYCILGQLMMRFTSGQSLGGALLADVLDRSLRSDIAAFSLLVDAKDAHAASFSAHHGFIGLPDSPLSLLLPLATAKSAKVCAVF